MKIQFSFKHKLLTGFILSQTLLLVLLLSYNYSTSEKLIENMIEDEKEMTSSLLVNLVKTPMMAFDFATVDDIIKDFTMNESIDGVIIRDKDKKIFSHYLLSENINEADANYIKKAIAFNQYNLGELVIFYNNESAYRTFSDNYRNIVLIIIIAMFFIISFAYIYSENVTKSLLKIKSALDTIANDKKQFERLNINSSDEFEFIANSINSMQESMVEKEKQVLESSRLAQMGEMISMIAHQWRQPLSSIATIAINLKLKMSLEALDQKTDESKETKNSYLTKRLTDIEDLVQDLSMIIDDFKDFYKPAKEMRIMTLDHIVQKSLNILKGSLNASGIEVIKECESVKEHHVYFNEMTHVILNIIKNAQDNFEEKDILDPFLKIVVKDDSISISDNGRGINEENMKQIFDPYFSTKTNKNGTGLGLYMSKKIIEDHHKGTLNAKNDEKGICFTITLKPEVS